MALIPSALLLSITSYVFAEPQIRENRKGAAISVSRLDEEDASDAMCGKDNFSGKVVARKFDEMGIALQSFTVEATDGSRDFINVAIPKNLNMALLGNVTGGLQTLTRVGRHASGQAFRCGAAGRVLYLDEIR